MSNRIRFAALLILALCSSAGAQTPAGPPPSPAPAPGPQPLVVATPAPNSAPVAPVAAVATPVPPVGPTVVGPPVTPTPELYMPLADWVPTEAEFPTMFGPAIQAVIAAAAAKSDDGYRNAIAILQTVDTSRGTESMRLLLIGYSQYNLKDYPAAIDSLKKSLDLKDQDPHTQYFLAISYKEAELCKEALNQLEELKFRLPGKHPDYYLPKAQCLITLEREPEAKTALDEGNKLPGPHPAIKKMLVALRKEELGTATLDFDTANQMDSDLTELAHENPTDMQLQLLFAKQQVRKGDIVLDPASLDEGETIAKKLAEASQYKDEVATKLLFEVQLKRRKYDDAQKIIDLAVQALPDSEVYADAQKQLKIEQDGLLYLKYQRE